MELHAQHRKLVIRPGPRLLAALAATALTAALGARAQTTAAVPAPASSAPAPVPVAAPWRGLDSDNTLVVETTKGRVVVEMRPDIAPLAVARIKTLTRRGYYDGSLFYRVLKDYMAQTGDKGARTFRSDLPNLKAEFTFHRTTDTPFVSVGDIPGGEVGFVGSSPVTIMKAAAGGQEQAWAQFCPGAAAMPHYDNPDTANSQLFFMRSWAPSLDKTFTVWGRVVAGQDVIGAINNGEPPPDPDKMTRVRIMADIPAAQRPDIRLLDVHGPEFAGRLRQAMQAKGTNFTLCDVDLSAPAP